MFFSVILPLFNKAPYVARTIQSVLSQSFDDFELIVVDDGSTDSSFEVASRAIGGDFRCQIVHQENSGVSAARNKGVEISHGDYLCFIDGDDWWAPGFLDRMNWLIREYPDAGIYGTNYFYVKNGRQRICVKNAETGYIDYCKVYSEGMSMPLTSISVAIDPLVFREFGGFKRNLKLGEDFDLWIRIALKYKVAFLNEPLAYYNQDSNPAWRGIRQLNDPQFHMLWNLSYLESEETINPSYKQLIDNLRVYGLFPYYLSSNYRELAKQELRKVDWKNQPLKTRRLYKTPIPLLKFRGRLRTVGARIKQMIIKYL